MNLNDITAGAIGTVNPSVTASLVAAAGGYSTAPDGTRTPTYLAPVNVYIQLQQLETKDLRQLASLNIQGATHKLWMTGSLSAVQRSNVKGGDYFVLQSGDVYLVTQVLEQWTDWVSAAVTLQSPSQSGAP